MEGRRIDQLVAAVLDRVVEQVADDGIASVELNTESCRIAVIRPHRGRRRGSRRVRNMTPTAHTVAMAITDH